MKLSLLCLLGLSSAHAFVAPGSGVEEWRGAHDWFLFLRFSRSCCTIQPKCRVKCLDLALVTSSRRRKLSGDVCILALALPRSTVPRAVFKLRPTSLLCCLKLCVELRTQQPACAQFSLRSPREIFQGARLKLGQRYPSHRAHRHRVPGQSAFFEN